MSALPNSPPRNADVHHRWIAAGRGGTRTAAMLSGNITLSISPDVTPQSARNTQPTPFAFVCPAHQHRRRHHIRQRIILKSP
jgi:hypothetical protein